MYSQGDEYLHLRAFWSVVALRQNFAGRLKVETSLAEGMRRQIHRRCTTESIAGFTTEFAAGFTAEFAVHLCGFVARFVLACAPYACAFIGADTGRQIVLKFLDIRLLGLP